VRRRRVLLAALIVLLAFAAVVGGLGLLVKQEPAFYAVGSPADEIEDDYVASRVLTRFGDLKNDIRSRSDWAASFSAGELNAFLRQNLDDGGLLAKLLPAGSHSPRVAIDGDLIKIAVRYGEEFWSSVVSVELRVWLVKDEVNTVAVELVGVRSGALPIEPQWLVSLDAIAEKAQDSNVDVTWYRHDGHLVGLFRFYADQPRPTTQIRTVKVADGRVTLAGRTVTDAALPIGAAPLRPEGE
jgi:hypothetical protein